MSAIDAVDGVHSRHRAP